MLILSPQKQEQCWMNEKALAKVKKKSETFKKYLETKEGSDYDAYCKARNQARRATRQAMKEFEHLVASKAKTHPKLIHSYINSKTKVKSGVPELITETTKAVSDEEKATALNKFFTEVFTREDLSYIPTLDDHPVKSNLLEIEISQEDIIKKLESLNPNKSMGYDGIHPKVLKETAKTIAKPLSIIFKQSLDTGSLPSAWKRANIAPIYKKGNKITVRNYRPVSLTSICCKTLEYFIRKEIMQHMTDNNLLYEDQHGFMEGRSCMTQLLSVMEKWTEILDQNQCIDNIYFDYQKAFDTVPHKRLKAKMKSYGIKGKVLRWVADFLHQRQQRVVLEGATSDWTSVLSGVPQGSVLGPVLFLLYINDIPSTVNSFIKLFADDTKLFRSILSKEDCDILQKDISKLEEWSRKWQLKFHPNKCKVLRMGNNVQEYTYTMTNEDSTPIPLENIEMEKDLGVN